MAATGKRKQKIAPMEHVLARYPHAYCWGYAGKGFISFHVKDDRKILGIGDTVRGAWRAAAAKLSTRT